MPIDSTGKKKSKTSLPFFCQILFFQCIIVINNDIPRGDAVPRSIPSQIYVRQHQTNYCITVQTKEKFTRVFFFLRFQFFMQNYLNKLTKKLQFQKTNNANRFYGIKQVENLHTIFLSDSILLVYYRQKIKYSGLSDIRFEYNLDFRCFILAS